MGGRGRKRRGQFQSPSECCFTAFLRSLLSAYGQIYLRNEAYALRNQSCVNAHTANESWIVNRGGQIVEKEAHAGLSTLSDLERLIYCLWVTDYMMRNAGDFANAEDMYPEFQSDAKRFAKSLGLAQTHEAFSLSQGNLQREYFDRFEAICDEIKSVDKSKSDG